MEAIRVLLADDHTLFRRGIATMLGQMPGIDVVGEAANGDEAVALANELVPDVILMDIKMPGQSGIDATRAILQENPHIGIILVTMFDDPESVFAGMRAGSRGYVLKEAEPEQLQRVVEAAHRGEVLLCPLMARRVLNHFAQEPARAPRLLPYEQLTGREMQVLQLAAEGLSNREIAGRLVISEKTAKNHIANIFAKLSVNDRTQAVIQALRLGLVTVARDDATREG
ncbi:MAG TPA: response regulator transcription factor [Dehalococcoidia bacterium]|nr:response regulator transcription factor [Dehalococcoidia bacterium]